MTREELLVKARFIQFPLSETTYSDYGNLSQQALNRLRPPFPVYRLPLPGLGDMYKGWYLNENHFTPKYHRKYVLPLLKDLLQIPYQEQDFDLIERTDQSGQFDLSYLKPRRVSCYSVIGLNRGEVYNSVQFETLQESSSHDARTEYHQKYYKYAHQSSRLVNISLDSDRKLFISGDSQMIPDILTLATYFKEIWYIDNRSKLQLANIWSRYEFTDVLVEMYGSSLNTYLVDNFM